MIKQTRKRMICMHPRVIITDIESSGIAHLRCMNPKCQADDRVHVSLLPMPGIGTVYFSTFVPTAALRSNLMHQSGFHQPSEFDYELRLVSNPPLIVFVPGLPAPQGSKRHVGNGILVESSKKVKPWRQAVSAEVHNAALTNHWQFMESGAVRIDLVFWMPAPQSIKRWLPSVKPDKDKLERSTLDGVTFAGNVVKDDAQITDGCTLKRYALPGMQTGAHILISALE